MRSMHNRIFSTVPLCLLQIAVFACSAPVPPVYPTADLSLSNSKTPGSTDTITPVPSHTPILKSVFVKETQAKGTQSAGSTQEAVVRRTRRPQLEMTQTAYYQAEHGTPTPILPLDFPAWVADPGVDILLTLIKESDEDNSNLTLVNAESGETVPLPEYPASGYFWLDHGSQIGLISTDHQEFFLIDTGNGIVTRVPANPRSTRFITNSGTGMRPYQPVGNSVESPDFVLLNDWQMVSYDSK